MKKVCFQCDEPEPDKVYSTRGGCQIDLHGTCVRALKKEIKAEIFEVFQWSKNALFP